MALRWTRPRSRGVVGLHRVAVSCLILLSVVVLAATAGDTGLFERDNHVVAEVEVEVDASGEVVGVQSSGTDPISHDPSLARASEAASHESWPQDQQGPDEDEVDKEGPHFLQRLFPNVLPSPSLDHPFPLAATWFLHPIQHVIEWLLTQAILLPIIYYSRKYDWVLLYDASTSSSWVGSLMDKVVGGAVLFVYPVVWYIKYTLGETPFMLQPCQMANVLLIYLVLVPKHWPSAINAFNIYLHNLFGMLMSILDPDLSGTDLPFEAEFHFLQHLLLGVVPLYYVLRRRYPLYRRRDLYSWWFMAAYHWYVLAPLSFPLNSNLNYMMAPPKRDAWLAGDVLYRFATSSICAGVNLVTYELWVSPAVKLIHRYDRSESKFLRALPAILLTAFVLASLVACEFYLRGIYGESRVTVLQGLSFRSPQTLKALGLA